MKSYDVVVIGGDGTGPEVTAEALKSAEAAAAKCGFKPNWHPFGFGGDSKFALIRIEGCCVT